MDDDTAGAYAGEQAITQIIRSLGPAYDSLEACQPAAPNTDCDYLFDNALERVMQLWDSLVQLDGRLRWPEPGRERRLRRGEPAAANVISMDEDRDAPHPAGHPVPEGPLSGLVQAGQRPGHYRAVRGADPRDGMGACPVCGPGGGGPVGPRLSGTVQLSAQGADQRKDLDSSPFRELSGKCPEGPRAGWMVTISTVDDDRARDLLDRAADLRKAARLPRSVVASHVGVGPNTLYGWERRLRDPGQLREQVERRAAERWLVLLDDLDRDQGRPH